MLKYEFFFLDIVDIIANIAIMYKGGGQDGQYKSAFYSQAIYAER